MGIGQYRAMENAEFDDENQLLTDGIYDQLFTDLIESKSQYAHSSPSEKVEDSDLSRSILNHLFPVIRSFIDQQATSTQKIEAANSLLSSIGRESELVSQQKRLLGIVNDQHSGIAQISSRTTIPFSDLALLTNMPNEPKIGNEIRHEIASADSIDIVMSFVKNGGVNFMESALIDFANRGGKIRLITTTYMGASDANAVLDFANKFNAEVRVSLDTNKDRLHAKSWIFHRNTGFSSAYVGSSNLSHVAMNDGNEWNVKISKRSAPDLFAKVEASFEALWNKDGLHALDPKKDEKLLKEALEGAKSGQSFMSTSSIYKYIDVEPKKHQIDMLDDLSRERQVFDRHWNLVVSATGTGKTILSALDYRRFVEAGKPRPKMLFVAHTKEILNQALETFRVVLRDQSFGELFVDGNRPTEWKHVFASIQSLNLKDLSELGKDFFDFVVIDEFHHAEAKTYKEFLKFIEPKELLALTATPERTDLVNVQDTYFQGRIASEIRLWDAINEGLLVPFQYFGIADGTDLSPLKWSQGAYSIKDLENVYTANDGRNAIIFNAIVKYLDKPESMKAIAFCVSKAHAEQMSSFFNSRGIKATFVTSDLNSVERDRAIHQLKAGEINVICAVNIFNEGVDIEDLDTVLFLRPTESPLIFLQQLGRGLRTANGKEFLTVLDFVGIHNVKYKFARKLQALVGNSKMSIRESIENDFPYLPSGCQIIFDKKSKEMVLEQLKKQISSQFREMADELRNIGDVSLVEFLLKTELTISDIFARNKSWSLLRSAAGHLGRDLTGDESNLSRRLSNFYYASDPDRNWHYRSALSGSLPEFNDQSLEQKILTSMLFWNLFPDGKSFDGVPFPSYGAGIDFVIHHEFLGTEIRQILEVAANNCNFVPNKLDGTLGSLPLRSHASYSRAELLAAFGYAQISGQQIWHAAVETNRSPSAHREGVWHSQELKSDLFLVTLNKSGNSFSPKTAYKDYAISRSLFHWESQNKDSAESRAGKRYLTHKENEHSLVLAVRDKDQNEIGTSPFQLLGTGEVVKSAGAFPLQLTLKMQRSIPSEILEASPVFDAS